MMKRSARCVFAGFVLWAAVGFASAAELSLAQIIEKNIAARGGLDALQKIQTMVWLGHVETANAPAPNLPFILEMKRPNKSRFEIRSPNLMAVRVYDGVHGWKMSPASGGRPEMQPYTAEELDFARDGQGLEMPFMNYETKDVLLDGVDDIEGHKAYRLRARMPSGAIRHVWIDARTFLVVKYDRESRNTFGLHGTVSVSYRNYSKVDGLQLPFLLESGVGTSKTTDKMVIDKILLNPQLDDRMFAMPGLPQQSKASKGMHSLQERRFAPRGALSMHVMPEHGSGDGK